MRLDITGALKARGEEIPFEHHDQIPPQDVLGEVVTFDEVLMKGKMAMADDDLHLYGKLTTVAHGHCACCLAPVDYAISVPFDEIFNRITRFSAPVDPAEEDERLTYEGSKVELEHLALTLAVLDLPIRFECEDCPVLPAFEPEDPLTHACQKDMPDQHPFSALQQLLTKDQEV